MSASVINGKVFADNLRNQLSEIVSKLKKPHAVQPTLAVLLVGNDPASKVYVKNKIKLTNEVGMQSRHIRLPEESSEASILEHVRALNEDEDIDGIPVQLPLPREVNSDRVIVEINPSTDVDGLTEVSAGRFVLGASGLRPCTPTGCVMLTKDALGELSGKHCVIIGRSILVGKPAALLFLEQNRTVTIAHSRTMNLEAECKRANILVAAVGRAEMVKSSWVKDGACVIDVGINRVPNPDKLGKTKLVGDVDYQDAAQNAGSITPVPDGVGPMTISCLLHNTLIAAHNRRSIDLPPSLKDV